LIGLKYQVYLKGPSRRKVGCIQALLRTQFSADHVAVEATPIIAGALEKIKTREYDVLIWDAVVAKTERSKGLELLDRLTKHSRTYIIVVTEQEGKSLPLDRLRAAYDPFTKTRSARL
jgi:DNA-binding response OmpR family regulator